MRKISENVIKIKKREKIRICEISDMFEIIG